MKRYTHTLGCLLVGCVLANGVTAEVATEELYERPRPTPPISWSLERVTQAGAMSQGSITFNAPVSPDSVQLLMLGGTLQELSRKLNNDGLLTSIEYAITVDTQLKTQPLLSLIVDEGDDRKPRISSYQLEVSDFRPEQRQVVNGLVLLPTSPKRED
ncbi:MAG: hypothetical protein ABNH02_10635 [Pseudomonadales bacterium]|jgi:hypothetical protein